jgi:lipopolysaccharide transport system ATP-binding protein
VTPLVRVVGLGKRFRRYSASRPKSLVETALRGMRRPAPAGWFWVFREVGFEVQAGEMIGIVGRNGAGKSTLLSLMAGLLRADEGAISLRGRVSALLDLGRSLHHRLTGRENIRTSALLSGLTSRQVAARADEIGAFAGIEQFLDAPVRTYSSGMKARLTFAVAIHTDPDILLIDEFLFVGDQFFQQRCIERIHALMRQGTAVLLSSHIASTIAEHCHRALWLDGAGLRALGPPNDVLAAYQSSADATGVPVPPARSPARPTA